MTRSDRVPLPAARVSQAILERRSPANDLNRQKVSQQKITNNGNLNGDDLLLLLAPSMDDSKQDEQPNPVSAEDAMVAGFVHRRRIGEESALIKKPQFTLDEAIEIAGLPVPDIR